MVRDANDPRLKAEDDGTAKTVRCPALVS